MRTTDVGRRQKDVGRQQPHRREASAPLSPKPPFDHMFHMASLANSFITSVGECEIVLGRHSPSHPQVPSPIAYESIAESRAECLPLRSEFTHHLQRDGVWLVVL